MKPWRSIRWRLLALFLLLAAATTAVFFGGLQRAVRGGWQDYAKPLLSDYTDRLAAEIGSPPDPARAAAIAERLPLTVRIDGPQVQWSSHPDEHMARFAMHDQPLRLVRRTADGHRIRFGLAEPAARWTRGGAWMSLAALLALTALAWWMMRRWLAPLEQIGLGAERFGRGEFEDPIRLPRRDDGSELGALAQRINRMAQSLHGMLEAQRTLLLAISHELRSPLTRARLNAELLPESSERDAVVRDLALMRDLVSDLLDSERLAAGHAALQSEPVDLVALAREAAAGRPVDTELPSGWPTVPADPARLRLLLRNLLDNAERHGAGREKPRLFLRRRADGAVELGVRDFGPGVAAEELPRLAEAFYRPDSARTRASGGVGLGLHLCQRVAQAHGGALELRNASPGLEVAMVWRPQPA
jgi:signal transduction histidine kinase